MEYSILKYEIENAALLQDYIMSGLELSKIIKYCLLTHEDPYITVEHYINDLNNCNDTSWLEKI